MLKYLVLDISNLLYRTYYANKNEDELTIGGLAMHSAMLTIQKYYKLYKPNKIIMTYDRPNWRKKYTKGKDCVSGKVYKANRRQNMTGREQSKYEMFLEHIVNFENLMKEHTSVVCLAADQLEADDLVGGVVQEYSENNEIIIVSTDKDFIQLLGYPNVKLISPIDGKPRTLEEWDNDAELFMFTKCLRGDNGDNVQSAFPRVRMVKILEAYNDPLKRVNMMEEKWTNHRGKEMIVKKVFKENEILMDLRKQPDEIRELIKTTVISEMENPGKYSYFHFMKFLGKYKLKKMAENAEQFAKMLNM